MSGGSLAANKRKILETARKLAQKGAKDKALKEYQRLVKLDPKDAKLRLEIGDAYRRWGQVDEAIDTYSKVADQYTKEGFDARAVAVFKQILNLDPARCESYQPLAELYERMGLTSEAISAFQMAADGFHKQGKKREALELLRKMATLDPSNTTSRIKVADLLRQEEMTDEAIAEYEAAHAELERQGEHEAAGTVLERILEVDDANVPALVALTRNLLSRSFAERAEPFAKRALDVQGEEVSHFELLAEVYKAQGRDEERHLARIGDRQCRGDPVLFPSELRLLAAQQGREHTEVLAHVPCWPGEGKTQHVLDHDLVGKADSEGESSAARRLSRERLLGHGEGVPRVGGNDRRAELDSTGLPPDDREGCDRFQAEDLREPQGRESQILDALRQCQ